MYVSDHGENMFDTAENISLHGGSEPTQYDIHVPFLVWSSDKYQKTYPQKWSNMEKNKDKKMSASVLFYSILDAAGITFPEQNQEKSIASEMFKEDSLRYMITPDFTVKVFK